VKNFAGRVLLLAIAILLFALRPTPAQQLASDYATAFDKTEVMIPMRDGIRLHTEIYAPRDATQPLPILFERTPYGISSPHNGYSRMLSRYDSMMPDGYIFVFQDIRGRYASEGKFVMLRPIHDPADPKGVDESTDAYDTIDWLIKNVPHNNGRVGLDGISYDGFLVTMGMINPHPAIKAVSEQACMGDVFLGDDFFHNGAFRLSYAFEYSALLETSNENYSFSFDRFDLYDWYLRLGALSTASKFPRTDSHVERFHTASELRRFLEASRRGLWPKRVNSPESQRRRMVGPGRLLRPDRVIRAPRKIRQSQSQLSYRGTLEPRWLGPQQGSEPRGDSLRQRHRRLFSPEHRSSVVRFLAEGQRETPAERSAAVPNRQRHLDRFRFLASS
jgi:hypothetical protein